MTYVVWSIVIAVDFDPMDLMTFHAVVVFGWGSHILFISILGGCEQ